jgi:hypothetical protein
MIVRCWSDALQERRFLPATRTPYDRFGSRELDEGLPLARFLAEKG